MAAPPAGAEGEESERGIALSEDVKGGEQISLRGLLIEYAGLTTCHGVRYLTQENRVRR